VIARNQLVYRRFVARAGVDELLAMQKVEGSSPFIRFSRKPRDGGVFYF
jgi:hypothetical protein